MLVEVVDREQAVEEIAKGARDARTKPSRAMWIATLVIGVVSIIAFVIALVADGEPTPHPRTTPDGSSLGFATGLALGICIGIAVGFAIARRRKPS